MTVGAGKLFVFFSPFDVLYIYIVYSTYWMVEVHVIFFCMSCDKMFGSSRTKMNKCYGIDKW